MVRPDRYLSKPDPVQAINRSVASPCSELGFSVEGLKPPSPSSHGGRGLGFRGFLRPHHLSPSSSSLCYRVIGYLLPLSPSHDFGVLEITMWAIRRAAIPLRWCFDLAHYFDHFPFVPYKNSICVFELICIRWWPHFSLEALLALLLLDEVLARVVLLEEALCWDPLHIFSATEAEAPNWSFCFWVSESHF